MAHDSPLFPALCPQAPPVTTVPSERPQPGGRGEGSKPDPKEDPYDFAWFNCPFDADMYVCGLRGKDVAFVKVRERTVSVLDVDPLLDQPVIRFFSFIASGSQRPDEPTGGPGSHQHISQLLKAAAAGITAWASSNGQAWLVTEPLVGKDASWRWGPSLAPQRDLLNQLYDVLHEREQEAARRRGEEPPTYSSASETSRVTTQGLRYVDARGMPSGGWLRATAGLVADEINRIWLDMALVRLGLSGEEAAGGGGRAAPAPEGKGGAGSHEGQGQGQARAHVVGDPVPEQGPNSLGRAWPCMLCSLLVSEELMREHVATHMVCGHVRKDELVGMCGCCGQQGCTPTLIKTSAKTVVRPYVRCRAGYFKEWSQERTEVDGYECSNTPTTCVLCTPAAAAGDSRGGPQGPFFWKYAMEQHSAEAHHGLPGPARGQPGAWLLGPMEMAHMQRAVENTPRQYAV